MIRRILVLVIAGVLAALLIRAYVVEGIYVASASMEPTLPVCANFFLEKITIKLHNPVYGDIVVFPSPIAENHDLIKRVIALPGDTIEIKEKAVFRNGVRLVEPYVKHTRPGEILEGDNLGPLVIPKGMIFVMGDNRDESGDSRDWIDKNTGEHIYFVALAAIKGKILQFQN